MGQVMNDVEHIPVPSDEAIGLDPRELPDRLLQEGDASTMELEGVEAFIDGMLVPPDGVS